MSEARVGSVDVENPKLAVTYVPKAVKHSRRYRDPRSSTNADHLIAKRELSLSVEDIEGTHVVPVRTWVYAESRAEAAVDYFEFR